MRPEGVNHELFIGQDRGQKEEAVDDQQVLDHNWHSGSEGRSVIHNFSNRFANSSRPSVIKVGLPEIPVFGVLQANSSSISRFISSRLSSTPAFTDVFLARERARLLRLSSFSKARCCL